MSVITVQAYFQEICQKEIAVLKCLTVEELGECMSFRNYTNARSELCIEIHT